MLIRKLVSFLDKPVCNVILLDNSCERGLLRRLQSLRQRKYSDIISAKTHQVAIICFAQSWWFIFGARLTVRTYVCSLFAYIDKQRRNVYFAIIYIILFYILHI